MPHAQVTTLLVARHPSLRPLAREAHDYLLSSLQKLDQPPSRSVAYHHHYASAAASAAAAAASGATTGTDASQLPRPVVLAVVGRSHLRYVQRNWGAIIDRRRLLNPRVHTVRRARSPGGGSGALAWLGRFGLPLLFLLGLVAAGALMVRVIVLLSAPPHLGLVTGRPGGMGPAGVLLR